MAGPAPELEEGVVSPGTLRPAAVLAGVVGGLVSGATGDYGDADESASLVLPADWAFGIWGPVYAGSLAYAAQSLRPSRRDDPLLRRTGWPAALAYAGAGTWVRLQDPPRRQLPAIALTMAAAATAYTRARPAGPADAASAEDRWTVRVPLGLFAGWITLATAAATTEVLLAEGLDTPAPVRDTCAVAVLGPAGGVAATVARRFPVSTAYPAAVVWGLTATAVRSLPRRRIPGAAAALGAVAVGAAARRWRSSPTPVRARGRRRPRAAR